MTNSDYTLIVLVVDRSGSMNIIRDDAQQMINKFVADQAKEPGWCDVTLADFDNEWRVVADRIPADQIDYHLNPRGTTALHDAMCRTAIHVGNDLASLDENVRPGKVIFVTVTDGHENASVEHDAASVKVMVNRQRDDYGWEFVFLGANQDAILTAKNLGIGADSSMTYDVAAAAGAGASLSSYVTRSRTTGSASFSAAERSQSRVK